ncbi:UDP-N-acetylmuramyl-tripeptide synthetase [Bombiscardovia apis]|uniref:UDP-N-acetylmuramyl-tripeptide synthetase n=1 Tax=Bombiscardovia apis TaxID=2932182 RepID=A0ABN6SGT7_9BIFI|nr:UDP-N-acetylmuramoyl-L-alanyl-D-glutamate--2,6-diaminopimelate ligase [Bombiscardovia apis]BDR54848.1 UDP-N-acetylmuramyl-tripeptide synthetase [Bombiscardovia apis]
MTVSLRTALNILRDHQLLREVITPQGWAIDASSLSPELLDASYSAITYDSRQVQAGGLLFCKGRFETRFLESIDQTGLGAYVAEQDFSDYTQATGIIVNNVRQAMSLISAEFYGRPQDELKIAGITGTKGKTTSAYYTQAIVNAASGGKAALLSSVDNCLDGKTYVESELTTPESLDLFRMMRQAIDNGMQYLVMEVSSQAYKVDRVYGLTFDVGAFLNVSPDHISPVEHPTFEDYLYCKRQITYNSRQLILGEDQAYAALVKQDAQLAGIPVHTFAVRDAVSTEADWVALPQQNNPDSNSYELIHEGREVGAVDLAMDGRFNGANAAAAFAIISSLGLTVDEQALAALAKIHIDGRMERFEGEGMVAYVDYAHNFASTAAILDFVKQTYGERKPYITLVTGSAGGKALDRRREIVEAAQTRANRIILTEEDTESADDPTADICQEMLGYVSNPAVDASIILDRSEAIEQAFDAAQAHPERFDVIAVIGKGNERWIKRDGKHVAYDGDDQVIARLIAQTKGKEEA